MHRTTSWFVGILCAVVVLLTIAPLATAQATRTALDDYIAQPDPSFSWQLKSTIAGPGYTAYHIQMTSQTWRTASEVSRPAWQHWMTIYKPTSVAYDKALMLIDGGSTGWSTNPPASDVDTYAGLLAASTRSVLVDLGQVPSQPLTFKPETRPRSEDALIAKSWANYFATGDITWAAQLPMAKSAVRAMDVVQSFMASPAGGAIDIEDFVVSGGSKRGWDTWLTAAVDNRVSAIIPIVADLLNTQASFEHHHDVYDGWSYAVQDYVNAGVMNQLDTPAAKQLFDAIDPYSYLDRLTMPKLIVNSTGDQFFLPDSSQFYFGELRGQNYLRYVPNTDHGLSQGIESLFSLLTFYNAQLNGTKLPEFTWSVDPDGTLRVQTDGSPLAKVSLWQATNANARDFRYSSIGPAFGSTLLADQGGGLYLGHVTPPTSGWKAYLVELTFADGNVFTTDVRLMNQFGVVPEPSTLALAAVGLAAAVVYGIRRQRRSAKTSRAAATVASMSASVCAAETNSASNWLQGM